MSAAEKLQQELDDIFRQYEVHFAGQPRPTRSLPLLDRLIARVEELLANIPTVGDDAEAHQGAREAAQAQLKLYREEHVVITAAQSAGPDFEEAAQLAGMANQVFACYHRHYAGKSRATRDLHLLAEMIDDLGAIEAGMTELAAGQPGLKLQSDLELVRSTRALYRGEQDEIAKARRAGPPEDRGGVLATLANDQFRIYKVHFAGRSRLGRRPQLIGRVIAALRGIRAEMAALQAAPGAPDWTAKNIQVVDGNLRSYEAELQAIQKQREQTALPDLQGHLGEEANEIFDEYAEQYAGKDRRTVELEKLGDLCDRLGEIARQMRGLLRASPSEQAHANLDVVMSHVSTFDREYEQIEGKQKGPPGAPLQ